MQKANVSPTQPMLNMLDKKLLGYSLAAGAVLAAGNAHAAVQYSGPVNHVIIPSSDWPVVFTAYVNDMVRNNGTYGYLIPNNAKNAATGLWGNVLPISYSATIASSRSFFPSTGYLANFEGAGPAYVGVQLTIGLNTHYGWIQLSVFNSSPNIVVIDWAWETEPDTPIKAGKTDASLSVALSGFSAGVESNAVILAWTTQSEVDNLGFALERCDMDGEGNLLSDWVEIASYLTNPKLAGKGNTSEASEYKISDPNVELGNFYGYRLIDVDMQGDRKIHEMIQMQTVSNLPEDLALMQNFPNPFNPETTIQFSIPEADQVTLSVYDLKGRTVDVLVNGNLSAGPHHVSWNGSDQPAGVYFYELCTGSHREIRKLMLVK